MSVNGVMTIAKKGAYRTGDQQWLWVPVNSSPGDAKRRLIVLCHSANYDCTAYTDPTNGCNQLLANLVATGMFGVMCIDAGGTVNWGNSIAQAAVDAAVTWGMNAAPAGAGWENTAGGGFKNDGVILMGTSMGVPVALNWLARQSGAAAKTKGLLGVLPAVDIDDMYVNNRGSLAAGIDAAYTPGTPAAPTVSGTSGVTQYNYKVRAKSALGPGVDSAASANFLGPLQASLGASPNTVTWSAPTPAAGSGPLAITGYDVLRSIGGGAYVLIGSTTGATSFTDNVTGGGSAYTSVTSPWTTNGKGASPSFYPFTTAASFTGVPMQMWYSTSDTIALLSRLQAFQTAVGGTAMTLNPTPTDAGHAAASMASIPAATVINQLLAMG